MNHDMPPEQAARLDEISWRVWVASRLVSLEQSINDHVSSHSMFGLWLRFMLGPLLGAGAVLLVTSLLK